MSILLGFGVQLRLVFPTLQENSSPLSVMTLFLETLGRKIDQADAEKAGMIESWNVMDLAHHFLYIIQHEYISKDRLVQKKNPKADQKHSWSTCLE